MSARRQAFSIAACGGYGRHTGGSRIKAHARFHLHFTGFLVNMVERFVVEITQNRIRRGTFIKRRRTQEHAIMQYRSFFSSRKISAAATRECLHTSLANHNADLKPFISTKSAGEISEILEKIARAKQSFESQH
jgi:hypothetical protein